MNTSNNGELIYLYKWQMNASINGKLIPLCKWNMNALTCGELIQWRMNISMQMANEDQNSYNQEALKFKKSGFSSLLFRHDIFSIQTIYPTE